MQYYFHKFWGLLSAKFAICKEGLIAEVWMSAIAYSVAVWDKLVTGHGVWGAE